MNDCISRNSDAKKQKVTGKDDWALYRTHEQKFINDLILMIRKKTTEIIKTKLIALITIEMHQKDLLEKLQGVSLNSHEWVQ